MSFCRTYPFLKRKWLQFDILKYLDVESNLTKMLNNSVYIKSENGPKLTTSFIRFDSTQMKLWALLVEV